MHDLGAQPIRHHQRIGGSMISYVDQGRGPPLLLGHGFLWDWSMWRPQLRALSSRCRMIVPELWGHGESGPLPNDIQSPEDIAVHMLELLDRLEIERCVVAGSSVGGMWAAHLAVLAPERVAGLMLINTYLGDEPINSRLVYAAMLDEVKAWGSVADHVANMIVRLFFADDIEHRAPELPQALCRRIGRFDSETLRRSIEPLGRLIFNRPNALGILPAIEAPVLIVAGANDRARPPHESRIMAASLDAALVEIAACGHTATLERPEDVNAAMIAFLDALAWGTSGGEADRPQSNDRDAMRCGDRATADHETLMSR